VLRVESGVSNKKTTGLIVRPGFLRVLFQWFRWHNALLAGGFTIDGFAARCFLNLWFWRGRIAA
jgi:hypothetical protein